MKFILLDKTVLVTGLNFVMEEAIRAIYSGDIGLFRCIKNTMNVFIAKRGHVNESSSVSFMQPTQTKLYQE